MNESKQEIRSETQSNELKDAFKKQNVELKEHDRWVIRVNPSTKDIVKLIYNVSETQHCTLSPAKTLKEAMTWSAVSVSAVSRDMKSMKAWKVTMPIRLGSTMLIMRANSFSPWWQQRWSMRLRRRGDGPHNMSHQWQTLSEIYCITWEDL